MERQITNGTAADAFSPDEPCTRAQIVTFLWRAAGEPTPAGEDLPFRDVPEDAYYAQAVCWAVEQGITLGTDSTHFSPDRFCTRAEMVTFLHRAGTAPTD